MAPRAEGAGKRSVRRLIAVAFLILWLLTAAATAALSVLAWQTIPTATSKAWMAERSTYYAGDIARQINGMAVVFTRGAQGELAAADIADIDRRLGRISEAMRALPPLLEGEDQQIYDELAPLVAELRSDAVRALEAAELDQQARFLHLVEENIQAEMGAIRPLVDELILLNEQESLRLLGEMNEDLEALLASTIVGGLLFLLILTTLAVSTLTRLRTQERALGRQMARLEQANLDLEAFAGRVADDLRGPLAPIALAAQQLERAADDPRLRALAARILASTQSSARLIDTLLAFSRAGEVVTEASCEASAAVERAVEEMRDAIAARGAELSVSMPPAAVAIEEALLQQILQNLLANSLRYANHQDRPRLTIDGQMRNDTIRIAVGDNGPGIPESERERVFEPFFRLDRRANGTGLGLATVRRIAEAHGGRVGITESRLGGAEVWVELPTATKHEARPIIDASHPVHA